MLRGQTLADFLIHEVIGRGGMGTVYRATQISLRRPVALKVIGSWLGDDRKARERFVREAQAAAAIEHASIVPIYAAGESDGETYIAMRLIRGRDTRAIVLRDGPFAIARAVGLVTQIASALDAAHAVRMIHRDVKPANILVADADGHAYLTDFGLAKQMELSAGLTQTGHWVGTPEFAAPEQIRGERPTVATDVYALGGVLFFLLSGRVPFPRANQAATLHAQLYDAPPRLSALVNDASPGLDAVIAAALAKDPADRQRSAGALARAARAALQPPRARDTRAAQVGAVALDRPPQAPSRPPRAAVLTGIGLLLAAVLVAGIWSSGKGGGQARTTAAVPPRTTSTPVCRSVATPTAKGPQHLPKPTLRLDPRKTWKAVMTTNCGAFTIALDVKHAPKTTSSFASLARAGFYDDLTFHRIAPNFVIQGGDPLGDGSGGPGYTVVEPPPHGMRYRHGVVAMAKTAAEPDGASGSQFFVVIAADAQLPPQYAVLGKVTKGLDVVDAIGALPLQTSDSSGSPPVDPVVISSVRVAGI